MSIETNVNIKFAVLKDTIMSDYAVIQSSIGKNSIRPERSDILVELDPIEGLTLITATDETTTVKKVGVIVEAFQPEEKQLFLVDPFLFDGHIKNINSDKLTISFDGKYLNVDSDNKQSQFLCKTVGNFFNSTQTWQYLFNKEYTKLPISLLDNLHKGFNKVEHTTLQDPTQTQKNCIELSMDSLATTDSRGHSLYFLNDSLPIPNDDKLMMDKADYVAIEKVILSILNEHSEDFYISFFYDKAKEKTTYMFIKNNTDTTFAVVHFLDLLPNNVQKRVEDSLSASTISTFSIDFDEWCKLMKMYTIYENKAIKKINSDSFTRISINDNQLQANIKIENMTEFNTQLEIKLEEGEPQVEMYIKAIHLFKILPSLKGTHKLKCMYKKNKKNKNLLVLHSDEIPNFKYFIQV